MAAGFVLVWKELLGRDPLPPALLRFAERRLLPYLRAFSRLVYACFCFSLSSFLPAKILVGPAGGFVDIGIIIPFRSGVLPLPYRPPAFRTWFRLKLLLRPGIGGLPLLTGDYPPPVDASFSVFLF